MSYTLVSSSLVFGFFCPRECIGTILIQYIVIHIDTSTKEFVLRSEGKSIFISYHNLNYNDHACTLIMRIW